MAIAGKVRSKEWVLILCMVGLPVCPQAYSEIPAAPENAALLYYQARIKYDKLEITEEMSHQIALTLSGRDPSDQVRRFMNQRDCQEVLFLLDRAGETSQCEWGFVISDQYRTDMSVALVVQALSGLVSVQARILAADGQYRPAIEKALGLRRFARHLGDDSWAIWMKSLETDADAFRAIQYILGRMSPDADTLTWLKGQLERVQGPVWEPRRTLQKWQDRDLWEWQAYPSYYADWKKMLTQIVKDEALRKKTEELPPAEVLERRREGAASFLESYLEIVEKDIPYREKYTQLKSLIDRVHAKARQGEPYGPPMAVLSYYGLPVNAKALSNAVKAAIEIYLFQARTGQLPEALPHGTPRDPFSGNDFEYERTRDGFTLRCREQAIDYEYGTPGKMWQFDFRAAQGGPVDRN